MNERRKEIEQKRAVANVIVFNKCRKKLNKKEPLQMGVDRVPHGHAALVANGKMLKAHVKTGMLISKEDELSKKEPLQM